MSQLINSIPQSSPDAKRALLARLLKENANAPKSFPLSFAQQRLWFLDQLEPNSSVYNMSTTVRLEGQLDLAALERSFKEIVRRHESLRTSFAIVDGRPVQFVHPEQTLNIKIIDLETVAEAEREAQVSRMANTEAVRPFDLSQSPLLRVVLFRLGERDHRMTVVMHHIITDGWSMNIFTREVTTLYRAFAAGLPSPLPELPIQYADFAHWQREVLDDEVASAQMDYWKEKLSGELAVLELPQARPRPAVQSHRGASLCVSLSKELTGKLRSLSMKEGATLFMTTLAAFKVLLSRYSGRFDIVLGIPIAGRNRAETQGLIGFFVNTLVLRTDLSGDPTFNELLSRVKETALGAYAHQDVPFERLVDEIAPERSLSHTPLFQVMFDLQNAPLDHRQKVSELSDLKLSPIGNETQSAKFDLSLNLSESRDVISAAMEYNTELFDRETIERMLKHYEMLLEQIVADPEQRISTRSLLTEAERKQLFAWNDSAREFDLGPSVHEMFEAQVERTPEATAVVFGKEQVTYRELNQRANQLANHLRERGVGNEVLVGIMMERSVEMIVCVLGVLKAGGAYLPLDPAYPEQRLSFMLEDAQASLILTERKLAGTLSRSDVDVICIDADTAIADKSVANLPSESGADDLAFVIYTTGSTGKPKGVMIQHDSLMNYIAAANLHYQINENDRFLQFASLSFDAHVEEMYPTLTCGATLVLRSEEMVDSITAFLRECEELKLTVVTLPTAFWHELTARLASDHLRLPPSLRLVILGGERALPDRVHTWHELVGDKVELINTYGPSEGTVIATACRLTKASLRDRLGEVPIGRPIGNVQTYILDQFMQLVPTGIPGELHIAGAGLARGYINRPELTAEKFVRHSFDNGQTTARLYKTGDLACYLPDGNIEFKGRTDQQIKLRGYRIELGEIEVVLSGHPKVRETAVIAREHAPGIKQVVAYLVAAPGHSPSVSELSAYLKQQLPDYMIPSAFMLVDELPFTPNGKVDRLALPSLEPKQLESDTDFVGPHTPVEKVLCDIWAETLRLERVGINDNFFELGGNSIMIIQVIDYALQAGLRLTARSFFENQTIAELAEVVNTTETIEIEQGVVTGPVRLTPIEAWFFDLDLRDLHHFNQRVMLKMRQHFDPVLVEQAIGRLLEHHDALRMRYVFDDGEWQQENAPLDGFTPFTCIDLSEMPAPEQRAAIEREADAVQTSLNLSEGPLMRVVSFKRAEGKRDYMLWIIHHLVVDFVSWRILLEDFLRAYEQLSFGQEVELPAKTTSFQRWADELASHANSEALANEASYWLEAERSEAKPLPRDEVFGANTVESSRTVRARLNAEETQLLLQDGPAILKTSIDDVLLAALSYVLARWTNNRVALVELEGHGREEVVAGVDVTRTVGWFTTLYPALVEISESDDVMDAVANVKASMDRLPNHGIGYGLLKYMSDDKEVVEKLRALPQPEVLFAYFGQPSGSAPDQAFERIASGLSTSNLADRQYVLVVEGSIQDKKLNLSITYSTNLHRESTIEKLVQEMEKELHTIAATVAQKKSRSGGLAVE